jgi:hypothetical protein
MSSLRAASHSTATLDIGRFAATVDKDRVSARGFTFADSRQCTVRSTSHPRQIMPAPTHLNATLTSHSTSVDSKQLTTNLNPLESTLTKNVGGRGVMVNQISGKEVCPEEHRDEGSFSKSAEIKSVIAQAFMLEACSPPPRVCAPALADESCE